PPGMVMVRKSDGTPWFLVDAHPITVGAFRQVFARHEQAGAGDDEPVVLVSYNEARSYATTRGGRLLTSEEWTSAAATPGFQASGDLLEWVDSPDEKNKVVRQVGKSVVRPDKPQKDVTFRMAKQL
ncbi:MAG TPA: SUMF1/EgtB/PvdO family nonheme iron enzyme, partial [Kofleriaceae bacterium]|nr:SUMF1/EgtB/PvdO family nonheme iron enzyme [Kofleriaceae bacterium]